jgi:hypothetical protein
VRAAAYVDEIQVVYRFSGPAPPHGGQGGVPYVFALDRDEHIVRIEGRSALYIDQLQFFTNKGEIYDVCLRPALFSDISRSTGRSSPPYGGTGGTPFSWIPPGGYQFSYFVGRR